MNITLDDYNFMVGLRSQSHASAEQAAKLRELYGKYINESRMSVLNSTCSTCVVEMMNDMCNYLQHPELKIID